MYLWQYYIDGPPIPYPIESVHIANIESIQGVAVNSNFSSEGQAGTESNKLLNLGNLAEIDGISIFSAGTLADIQKNQNISNIESVIGLNSNNVFNIGSLSDKNIGQINVVETLLGIGPNFKFVIGSGKDLFVGGIANVETSQGLGSSNSINMDTLLSSALQKVINLENLGNLDNIQLLVIDSLRTLAWVNSLNPESQGSLSNGQLLVVENLQSLNNSNIFSLGNQTDVFSNHIQNLENLSGISDIGLIVIGSLARVSSGEIFNVESQLEVIPGAILATRLFNLEFFSELSISKETNIESVRLIPVITRYFNAEYNQTVVANKIQNLENLSQISLEGDLNIDSRQEQSILTNPFDIDFTSSLAIDGQQFLLDSTSDFIAVGPLSVESINQLSLGKSFNLESQSLIPITISSPIVISSLGAEISYQILNVDFTLDSVLLANPLFFWPLGSRGLVWTLPNRDVYLLLDVQIRSY